MIRHIRFADLAPEPWRNSGGTTTEVARSAGSGDDFHWRISIAVIAADGPFSVLAGVDRCLVVLAGAVTLACGDNVPAILDPGSPPFRFAGAANSLATLPDGPAAVLNIMTGSNGPSAAVWRHGDGAGALADAAGGRCFLNTAGPCAVQAANGAPMLLDRFDALLCDAAAAAAALRFAPRATGIWVAFSQGI